MKLLLTLALILVFHFNIYSAPELRGTPDDIKNYVKEIPDTVSISAKGEVKVDADYAYVTLSLIVEERSFEDSLNRISQLKESISKSLIAKGVLKDEIKFDKFTNTPNRGVFGSKSYTVKNKAKIKIFKPNLLRDIARIVDNNNEVHYGGVLYKHSQNDDYKKEALIKACRKINEKKEIYEKELGIKLKVKKFHEGGFIVAQNRNENYNMVFPSKKLSSSYMSKSPSIQLEGGGGDLGMQELTYSFDLSVEYLLLEK